jgi:hypothetical protein
MTDTVDVHVNGGGIQVDARCCDDAHCALISLNPEDALAIAAELVRAVMLTHFEVMARHPSQQP